MAVYQERFQDIDEQQYFLAFLSASQLIYFVLLIFGLF